MEQNELVTAEKQVSDRLSQTERSLKETRQAMTDFSQLSKRSIQFLEETLAAFGGSSERSVFQRIFDDQVFLGNKIQKDLEQKHDDLEQEYRRLTIRQEELAKERQQLEREEADGS